MLGMRRTLRRCRKMADFSKGTDRPRRFGDWRLLADCVEKII
jgi:hypothetical protein